MSEIAPTMTYAEAAEGIRATIATYAQALDDGRTEDLLATWTPDGVFDVPGMGTYEGLDQLREMFSGTAPKRPQRHLVVNTAVVEWDGEEAKAISDFVFLQLTESGWSTQVVGRYNDTLLYDAGRWVFRLRALDFVS
jgi:uncharacterized protein (TIGR02246 family)